MTPEQCRATYRRMLDLVGEDVIIRRYTGSGASRPKFDATVRARVTEYEPRELVGLLQQGDRRLIVMADDLVAAQFSLPLHKGDKAVVRGKELNIETPDDNTRRVDGELIAYELQVRG